MEEFSDREGAGLFTYSYLHLTKHLCTTGAYEAQWLFPIFRLRSTQIRAHQPLLCVQTIISISSPEAACVSALYVTLRIRGLSTLPLLVRARISCTL